MIKPVFVFEQKVFVEMSRLRKTLERVGLLICNGNVYIEKEIEASEILPSGG